MADQTPTQHAAERKQWIADRAEAIRILRGESMLLAELRHLIAVARDAAESEARAAQLGQILAAILHDSEEVSLRIPGRFLKVVRETPILVAIHPQADGSVVVEKVMRRPR